VNRVFAVRFKDSHKNPFFVRGDVNRYLFVNDTLNAFGLLKIFHDLRQKSRAPFDLVEPNLDQAKGRSTLIRNASQRKSPAMIHQVVYLQPADKSNKMLDIEI
jgi:hypothetical protein